jgi:hypothetical protein
MQVTQDQVRRSMLALRAAVPAEPAPTPRPAVPSDALDRVSNLPEIRQERVDEAIARLAAGSAPTSEELADRVIGRMVCDRLR